MTCCIVECVFRSLIKRQIVLCVLSDSAGKLPKRQACTASSQPQTEAQIAQTSECSDHPVVDNNAEHLSSIVKQAEKQMIKPYTACKLAVEGSSASPSAKNDRHPSSQKMIGTEKHMEHVATDRVSTEDTTVALCIKKELEAVVSQSATTFRVGNVVTESTDILAPEVLLEVPPTEVSCFAKPRNKFRIGVEENKSVQYSSMCLVDPDAVANRIT